MGRPLPDIVMLCSREQTASDYHARKIAETLGAEVEVVSLSGEGEMFEQFLPQCRAVIVHANTLSLLACTPDKAARWREALANVAAQVFIYGFDPTERHRAILRIFSSDSILGVEELPARADCAFHVTGNHRRRLRQLSGVTIRRIDPAPQRCFIVSTHPACEILIRAGDKPFFLSIKSCGSEMFFVAGDDIADLDEELPRHASLLLRFGSLAPILIFLRAALGDRVWSNDRARACFIIDDPLLKQRYGFLDYRQLAATMQDQKFSAAIAFIPWNYRRSSSSTTRMFSSGKLSLSVCIHGCDHTRAEFAGADVGALAAKASTALQRMREHKRCTGVSFDEVIVFPQGLFSPDAMAALRASGYLAAVNTDLSPATVKHSLTLRDALEVALTRFEDFPLFGRRYPNDIAEIAFDLFLGKPALLVEHHGYFRNGYGPLNAFIAQVNALDQGLEWTNLADICSHACVTRTDQDGVIEIRFFTDRFSTTNTTSSQQNYVLLRRCTRPLRAVLVKGKEANYQIADDELKLAVSLGPGETADIHVLPRFSQCRSYSWNPNSLYRSKVLVRRVLSEIRDNYVDTTPVLSSILYHARKLTAPSSGSKSGV